MRQCLPFRFSEEFLFRNRLWLRGLSWQLLRYYVFALFGIYVRWTYDKRQLILETAVGGIHNFFEDIVGKEGKKYIPYLMSVGIYIGIANLIGLLGFKPPTKDMNVTAALAIMSIILIEYAGFHQKGLKKWVKSFAEPMPIIAPINVLEVFIKPLSLCMRLFGNVLGAFVVMELIKIIMPVLLPIPFQLLF